MSGDFLTFFRNRQHDEGRPWKMKVERPEGAAYLLFYSKRYDDLERYAYWLMEFSRENPNGHGPHKTRLTDALQGGGGGLLVESLLLDGRLRVYIHKIASAEENAYHPPSAVFHSNYGEATDCPFPGETLSLDLEETAQVVLPVDREAELAFRSFREHYAAWFPPGFEGSMLELLRRPGLGLRLDALERRMAETTGPATAPPPPPPRKPPLRAAATLALAAALAMAACVLSTRAARAGEVVEVFTDPALFRLAHAEGAAVYDLSAPRQLMGWLGQGLPRDPGQAKAVAAGRLGEHRQRLAAAFGGLALAAQYGIAKIPAVVFNHGEAVAYGITDVAEAAALHRRWKESR